MDTHKGHLFVKSEGEGHGTAFTLLLPIVQVKSSNVPLNSSGKSKFGSQQSLISHVVENANEQVTENITNESTSYSLNQIYSFSSNFSIIKSESAKVIENSHYRSTSQRIPNYVEKELLGKLHIFY